MVNSRTATIIPCPGQAQLLARSRPLFVALPLTVSKAQAQLTYRGVDVFVCAERDALLQLFDAPTSLG